MIKKGLLLLTLLLPAISYAEIFQCRDSLGQLIYRDSECHSGDNVIRADARDNASNANPPEIKNLHNTIIEDDKPGQLIFQNKKRLAAPYNIKVDEVRIISETDDRLVVDVIYTYKNTIPANEIKIYVVPDHSYWSVNSIQAKDGFQVARANIGLSRSNMKKKWVTRSSTTVLNIRFEHYPPDNTYKGVIWSVPVKYKKNWKQK